MHLNTSFVSTVMLLILYVNSIYSKQHIDSAMVEPNIEMCKNSMVAKESYHEGRLIVESCMFKETKRTNVHSHKSYECEWDFPDDLFSNLKKGDKLEDDRSRKGSLTLYVNTTENNKRIINDNTQDNNVHFGVILSLSNEIFTERLVDIYTIVRDADEIDVIKMYCSHDVPQKYPSSVIFCHTQKIFSHSFDVIIHIETIDAVFLHNLCLLKPCVVSSVTSVEEYQTYRVELEKNTSKDNDLVLYVSHGSENFYIDSVSHKNCPEKVYFDLKHDITYDKNKPIHYAIYSQDNNICTTQLMTAHLSSMEGKHIKNSNNWYSLVVSNPDHYLPMQIGDKIIIQRVDDFISYYGNNDKHNDHIINDIKLLYRETLACMLNMVYSETMLSDQISNIQTILTEAHSLITRYHINSSYLVYSVNKNIIKTTTKKLFDQCNTQI